MAKMKDNGEENNGENIENRKASKAKMASAAMAKNQHQPKKSENKRENNQRRISGINGVINNIEKRNLRRHQRSGKIISAGGNWRAWRQRIMANNENRQQEIWRGGINVELNVNGGGENHQRQRNGEYQWRRRMAKVSKRNR
jgi:predicted Zn-dependent protease